MFSISKNSILFIGACTLAVVSILAINFISVNIGWYIALAFLLGSSIFYLIFRKPHWGAILMVFALPFERLGAYEAGGTTIRLSQIFLLATVAAWFSRLYFYKQYRFARNPVLIPIVLFMAIQVASLTQALNSGRSMTVLAYILFTAIAAAVIPNIVTTKQQLNKILVALLISFVLVSGFGLFQFLGDMAGLPQSLTGLRDLYTKDVLGFTRVQSTAYEPLYFANYLLIPIAIVFALWLAGSRSGDRWKTGLGTVSVRYGILLLLLGLGMVNLVLTVSRGGYLAVAAVLLVAGFWYWKKLFRPTTIIVMIICVVAVGYVVVKTFSPSGEALTLDKFKEHVSNVFYGASYNERVDTIETAVQAWREHPLIGVGVGGFGPYAAPHPFYEPKDGWRIVNNEYIEVLAESGLLGLACFISLIIFLIIRSWGAARRTDDPYLKSVMVGLLAAFLGVLVQYLTFSTLYVMHIWVLIGLMIAVQNMALLPVKKGA
ncbi:MAG: O-antigen ligase family protein [Patescibacteria group bacterium]